MIMHPAEGKGFFHGLHLLNAGMWMVDRRLALMPSLMSDT
jgi:hypothetical protein